MFTPGRREWIGGCGFILGFTLLSCVLLIMNGGVVATIYFSLAAGGPEIMQDPRLAQLTLFAAPVCLLLLEWRLIDFAGERFSRPGRGLNRRRSKHADERQ